MIVKLLADSASQTATLIRLTKRISHHVRQKKDWPNISISEW